jgi:cyclohexanecarboxylate-CoA ligase
MVPSGATGAARLDLVPDNRPRSRPLHATWVPGHARRYRRPGGPWHVPTLDELISKGGGEVVDGSLRLGPGAVDDLAARVAGGLAARGVRRGQVVTWQLPNCAAAVVLLRACWRLGAVAAPVLHTLGPSDTAAALSQVEVTLAVDPVRPGEAGLSALLEQLEGPPVPAGAVPVSGADVATVLFTSGSSGTPKAVLHTHRGLAGKAQRMAAVHGVGSGDTVLAPAPLAHVSGMLSGVLIPGAAGLTTVLMPRFDPAEALALVAGERVSFLAGPPTFFVAMTEVAHAGHDLSSLRLVSCGGAPVSPSFVDATAAALGCTVKRTYGSTEAPMVTTTSAGDPPARARDSDGRALEAVELRVVDPTTGRALAAGEVGELWVRGPELFAGYSDRCRTSDVIAPGGWFRTGDLATLDPGGWLRIAGRLRDLIIRGGENVYAAEVEAVLEAHPDVRQAVVVGVPDPLMGERVAAFVVARRPLDAGECRRWFAERGLARFKAPEHLTCLDRLPVLASGKPDRAALSQQAAKDAAAQLATRPGASR